MSRTTGLTKDNRYQESLEAIGRELAMADMRLLERTSTSTAPHDSTPPLTGTPKSVLRSTTTVAPLHKQVQCVKCDKKVPDILCIACNIESDVQAKALNGDLDGHISRLYSHLCRSAAVMCAVLPRKKKESNEKYMQRLLKEADKTEASGEVDNTDIRGRSGTQIKQKLSKEAGSKARYDSVMEGYNYKLGLDLDRNLKEDWKSGGPEHFDMEDSEEDTYDSELERELDELEELEELAMRGRKGGMDHGLKRMLAGGGVSRCPTCDWKIHKGKCMKCGHSVGDKPDIEDEDEDDDDNISALMDKLMYGR